MIENKFRGQRINDSEWVYGGLVKSVNDRCYIVIYATEDAINTDYDLAMQFVEVVPKSVGQLIGRKDDQGFEMYTGDVVGLWGGEYYNGCWEFTSTETIHDIRDVPLGIFMAEHARIYGNLYQASKSIGECVDV